MNIPSKSEREQFEIENFIIAYSDETKKKYEIIEKNDTQTSDSQPDYIVKDLDSNELFYVELTSVYLDDRSFKDRHWKGNENWQEIKFDREKIRKYKFRVLRAIKTKATKAENYPKDLEKTVLSIQLNEFEDIFIKEKDWKNFIIQHKTELENIDSIDEVLLWIRKSSWADNGKNEYKSLLIKLKP